MIPKRLAEIQRRIAAIKAELAAIQEMRPGSLTRQYKDPKSQRGAYYQLSYTREMKSRTEYIPRERVRDVRRQIASYKRFKALTTKWIALSIEQCRLKMKLATLS
jgi:hypothetical protein